MTVCKTVKRRKQITVKILLLFFCITAGTASLIMSRQISDIIIKSAVNTVRTVLPSLFPFMIISSFMASSDLYGFLAIFPGKLLAKTVHVNQKVTGAILLGLISGFPVGVKSVCEMYKNGNISKSEAEIALCQAHNTGPAFPVCFIGTYLWGSTVFGLCVYAAQIFSMLLLSMFLIPSPSITLNSSVLNDNEKKINYIKSLTDSITKSAFNCITICASVTFWKTVCSLLSDRNPTVNAILTAVIEFSSGAVSAARLGGNIGAFLTGFAVGFSGLAAISQAAGITSECGLSLKKALNFKILQGLLCSFLCMLFYIFIK